MKSLIEFVNVAAEVYAAIKEKNLSPNVARRVGYWSSRNDESLLGKWRNVVNSRGSFTIGILDPL